MSTAEFGQLIDREYEFLNQLAMKLTKQKDDAEDLIQDTYYKALKNKDKFATGTNLKGIQRRLTDPQGILDFDLGGYAYRKDLSEPDKPVFVRPYDAN